MTKAMAAIGLLACLAAGPALCADYLTGDFQQSRGYSTAIATEGGKTIWLAGEGGTKDRSGKDISNDMPAQVETIFAKFAETLAHYGGTTDDIVKMTVFIKDQKDGTPFTQMRRTFFSAGNYPASSLITVKDLALPGMMIEIEAVAVIGDRCKPGLCSSAK